MKAPQDRIPGQDGDAVLRPQVFFSPQGEPAWVASTAAAGPALGFRKEAGGHRPAKESLALFLAQLLLERQLTDLALDADAWGKPRIWLNGAPGPALSFSWSAGRLWAAVGRSASGLGLDAAAPEEFAGSYPYRRVFGEDEWQEAVALTAGGRAEAAALVWSVKEAMVKAIGCGFHFASPKEVKIHFTAQEEEGYLWGGSLQKTHQQWNLSAGGGSLQAVSVRLKKIWLAVAWGRSAMQPFTQ